MSGPPTDSTDPPRARSSVDPSDSPSDGSRTAGAERNAPGAGVAFDRLGDRGDLRRRLSPERLTLLAGVLALVTVFALHRASDETYLVFRWSMDGEDWLLLLACVVVAAYVVVPLTRRPDRTKRYLRRLSRRPGATLALLFVLATTALGGWVVLTRFLARIPVEFGVYMNQPPIGAQVSTTQMVNCAGERVGGVTDAVCRGSRAFPLGTDARGQPMTQLLVSGSRPVVYATLVSVGLIVPMATVVGVVAGYYGGVVDDLLMSYVDVQLSVPAIFVYLVAYMFVINSGFVFLVAFGLLSWGGIARLVRSDALRCREEGYITSAHAVGTSDVAVIKRHVLPNVANSVVPATFHLIAIIVLTEAALSFLGFSPFEQSWGTLIGEGLQNDAPLGVWWVSVFPMIALASTIVACKVAGDGFRDVLAPRGDT